ncbi:chromosome partitioning protein [Blastococcus sp. Marseille-P5729]|uniref:AAA family ATPase n=1 Tax=Blastococcus sp. Marseille-P5729 TaxID=2086582 RepID=UPI00131E0B6F|nr:chromosome partitioning protein [Blastococcus sp. Marseille-P5729]
MAAIGVVTAIANPALEAVVVSALSSEPERVTVVRRCVEMADVLAVAASGAARVVVIGEGFAGLDADLVGTLLGYGATPVAIGDPASAWPASLRIPVVLDAATPGPELVDQVAALISAGVPPALRTPPPDRAGRPRPRGRVVGVWGAAGAPGRSTVALGIADEAARSGTPTLLIDADVYGGALATMLGLLDESPGVAAACRAAGAGTLDVAALARTCLQGGPAPRVLTGISRSDRWPQLRPAAVQDVLAQARELAALTVVDCGFSIEQDEELAYDTFAPRRNGATIAVLEHADDVLVVTGCDPVGVARGIRAVQELRELLPACTPRVVVNKLRAGVFNGEPTAQLEQAFQRFAGVPVAAVLPWDGKGCDTALLRGRMLAEVAPSSPLRKQLTGLAHALTGSRPARARKRERRPRRG